MFVQYVGGTSWRKLDYRSGVGWVAFLRTSTLFSSISILILSISPLSPIFFFVAGWKASNGGNDGHELRKPSETIAPTVSAW